MTFTTRCWLSFAAAWFLVSTALSGSARAQHLDILLAQHEGAVHTGGFDFGTLEAELPMRIFVRGFDFEEEDRASGNDPGFNAVNEPPLPYVPLPSAVEIFVHGVSPGWLGRNLAYWSGIGTPSLGPVPDSERFHVALGGVFGPIGELWLDGSDTEAPGFAFAETDEFGAMHQHLELSVVGESQDGGEGHPPTPGVYVVPLAVQVADLEPTPPVLLVMHHGVAESAATQLARCVAALLDADYPAQDAGLVSCPADSEPDGGTADSGAPEPDTADAAAHADARLAQRDGGSVRDVAADSVSLADSGRADSAVMSDAAVPEGTPEAGRPADGRTGSAPASSVNGGCGCSVGRAGVPGRGSIGGASLAVLCLFLHRRGKRRRARASRGPRPTDGITRALCRGLMLLAVGCGGDSETPGRATPDASTEAGAVDAPSAPERTDAGPDDSAVTPDASSPKNRADAQRDSVLDPDANVIAEASLDSRNEAPADAAADAALDSNDAGSSADARNGEPLPDSGYSHPDGATTTDSGSIDCPIDYRAGHGDLFLAYQADTLTLSLRSHLELPGPGGDVPLHDPAAICIHDPASSHADIAEMGGRPEAEAFEPIGVAPGAAFWVLSQNNLGAAQPFWGLATEGVPPTVFDGALRFEFQSVDGPDGSEFSVYQASFPPRFFVSTSHPDRTYLGGQAVELPAGGHDHYNWTFSHPGVYDVTVVASGRLQGGGLATSNAQRYRFVVEPLAPD